jgi:two-component system cell cycle sensor histidine kinase/response regulator CckA
METGVHKTGRDSDVEEHLGFLYRAARTLLASERPADLLASVFSELSGLIGLDLYFSHLFHDSRRFLLLDSSAGVSDEEAAQLARVPLGAAVCGLVAERGEAIVVENVQQSRDSATMLIRGLGVRAYACHPLRAGEHVVGTLSFGTRARDAFTAAEIELMAGVTDLAAVAVERSGARAERMRAEELSAARERHLQAVLEAEPECVKLVSRSGDILEMNPAGIDLLGAADATQVIGRGVYDFIEPAHRALFLERTEAAFAGEQSAIEFVLVGLDGTKRWMSSHIVPFRDQHGTVTAALSITRDITAQKAAHARLIERERHYRSLIENLSDLVLVIDVEGTIHFCSPSVERSLGWRADELEGRGLSLVVHPDDRDRAMHRIRERVAGGELSEYTEIRGLHRDGTSRTFEGHAALYRGPASDLPAVVITARDVTEQRDTERQLRQAQKMEAVGRLAAGMAHDFNNVLTAIAGHAEFARQEADSATMHGELTEILSAADRAASLTRQLLAFSRRQVLEPRVLDLRIVIADLQRMLGRLIPGHITLDVRRPDTLRAVRLDRNQVEQVIVNLAVNARDAMSRSGVLTIETCDVTAASLPHSVPPGEYVMLSVRDTGTGMDRDTLARAFEPFFTTKQHGKGSGLGLSTVYGIVQQSGGHIVVDSRPDGGTRFDIFFPATDDPVHETAAACSAVSPAGSESILFVEDEATVRAVGVRALEQAGYRVISARDGNEALRLAERYPGSIDLLVTDISMPAITGIELAARLRQVRPDTRVLYITGYAGDDVHRDLSDRRGAAILEKPFAPADLACAVRDLLDA